jgi:hypothetical protein
MGSGSSGSGITPPYDLSSAPDQASGRSPTLPQNSPPSFLGGATATATATTSDCKYRDDEPSCQQVKMEQLNAQQQHHHQQQQQQQRYCDPKYDGYDVVNTAASTIRYGGGGSSVVESGVHFPMPSMSGPYLSPNVSAHSGGSAVGNGSSSSYQYGAMAGLHRQMFNPIAAAVPSEQGWERYT